MPAAKTCGRDYSRGKVSTTSERQRPPRASARRELDGGDAPVTFALSTTATARSNPDGQFGGPPARMWRSFCGSASRIFPDFEPAQRFLIGENPEKDARDRDSTRDIMDVGCSNRAPARMASAKSTAARRGEGVCAADSVPLRLSILTAVRPAVVGAGRATTTAWFDRSRDHHHGPALVERLIERPGRRMQLFSGRVMAHPFRSGFSPPEPLPRSGR